MESEVDQGKAWVDNRIMEEARKWNVAPAAVDQEFVFSERSADCEGVERWIWEIRSARGRPTLVVPDKDLVDVASGVDKVKTRVSDQIGNLIAPLGPRSVKASVKRLQEEDSAD